MYDKNNIFAKILRKEIPAKIRYEDDVVLCFDDINPIAPVHILVISKKPYVNFADFISHADENYIASYFKAIKLITKNLDSENKSYRLVVNNGEYSGQTVMHFHTHIIAGKQLKELV